jgi:hypothetical protein
LYISSPAKGCGSEKLYIGVKEVISTARIATTIIEATPRSDHFTIFAISFILAKIRKRYDVTTLLLIYNGEPIA